MLELLNTCLTVGISEWDFWQMTVGEIKRYIAAYNQRRKNEEKQIAYNNYILADLIGASVGRLFKGTFPGIVEVYPSLFEEEANSPSV